MYPELLRLEKEINLLVNRAYEKRANRLRCHEVVSLIKDLVWDKFNYPLRVCDGFVTYRKKFILFLIRHEYGQKEMLSAENRIGDSQYEHSWCESEDGLYVIDFHPYMHLDPSNCRHVMRRMLVAGEKKKLVLVSYEPVATRMRVLGRDLIVFPEVDHCLGKIISCREMTI